MPRVSKEQMALNHERVVEHASRLVREHGAAGVSVADLMGAAGMTPGGFYKHFTSKDDLLARAGEAAFDDRLAALSQLAETAPDRAAARERFISDYLSTTHRDHPGHGCAAVALAADAARRDVDDPVHRGYVAGLRAMAEALNALLTGDAEEPPAGSTQHDVVGPAPDDRALADLATLVGAVVVARATTGDAISERILAAARDRLLEP